MRFEYKSDRARFAKELEVFAADPLVAACIMLLKNAKLNTLAGKQTVDRAELLLQCLRAIESERRKDHGGDEFYVDLHAIRLNGLEAERDYIVEHF